MTICCDLQVKLKKISRKIATDQKIFKKREKN